MRIHFYSFDISAWTSILQQFAPEIRQFLLISDGFTAEILHDFMNMALAYQSDV